MTVRLLSGRRLAASGVLAGLMLVCWRAWAQPPRPPAPSSRRRLIPNVHYGPHDRNVLDVWRAKPDPGRPGGTPIVVFFHGGGFRQGDKAGIPARLLVKCLNAGISVASANYRLSQDAPYPAPMRDGARAIQYLRMHARGVRHRPGAHRGLGQLGRRGDRPLGRLPRRPGRSQGAPTRCSANRAG